jgi:predicted DCC family thiol-disulfide oxidoreductase YuxK
MTAGDRNPVVLFDGVCKLCCGVTRWIIEHDDDDVFRFAPLQSDEGRRLLEEHGLPLDDISTIVLVDEAGAHTRSDAALRIAARLGGVWRALSWFRVVPRPLRDATYRLVAKYRYRWFGKRDSCMAPDESDSTRFVGG